MQPLRIHRHLVVLIVALTMALIAPLGASAAVPDDGLEPSPMGGVWRNDNLATIQALFDQVFNGEDADAASLLIADDAVLHTTRFGDWTGPQGVLDYVAFVKRACPDATFTLDTVRQSGDSVHLTWTMTASQIQMDPTELPYATDVRIDGSAEIALSDSQIGSLDFKERSVAITSPQPVAYEPLPGQPF